MGKQQFIKELQEGDRTSDLFLVKSSRLAETRAGKAYIQLTLMDKSGEIEYTPRGRLKGHLVIGSEMVVAEAGRI